MGRYLKGLCHLTAPKLQANKCFFLCCNSHLNIIESERIFKNPIYLSLFLLVCWLCFLTVDNRNQ